MEALAEDVPDEPADPKYQPQKSDLGQVTQGVINRPKAHGSESNAKDAATGRGALSKCWICLSYFQPKPGANEHRRSCAPVLRREKTATIHIAATRRARVAQTADEMRLRRRLSRSLCRPRCSIKAATKIVCAGKCGTKSMSNPNIPMRHWKRTAPLPRQRIGSRSRFQTNYRRARQKRRRAIKAVGISPGLQRRDILQIVRGLDS